MGAIARRNGEAFANSANSLGNGAPAATRTRDPRLRRPMRYPTELRARRSTVIASLNRYGAAALSPLLNPAALLITHGPLCCSQQHVGLLVAITSAPCAWAVP